MNISTNEEMIKELMTRGVANIYPTRDFLDKELKSGRQLTLYTGYDPTAPTLHIGHGITMLKLRQFQDLGHKIIMLIGDFTGMIGDPTDKTAARKRLTREEILENCKKYKEQASTILRFEGENPVEVKYNNDWLGKMNFADVVELSSHFTVQQILERDMFEKRMAFTYVCPKCKTEQIYSYAILSGKEFRSADRGVFLTRDRQCENCNNILTDRDFFPGEEGGVKIDNPKEVPINLETKPIYLHEFLYPLMQGYDSVAMNVDGEIGGNDQTFNMLTGRTLMKEIQHKEKFVLTVQLLADENGKKMGKSEGNMIALADDYKDIFGKVMKWTDGMIIPGFKLCTRVSMKEIDDMEWSIKNGENPMRFKKELAKKIVETFYVLTEEDKKNNLSPVYFAEQAELYFQIISENRQRPDEIPELVPSVYDIVTVLVEAGFVKSKSEAQREIEGGGVKINDVKVIDYKTAVNAGDVVQKGKRFFVTVK